MVEYQYPQYRFDFLKYRPFVVIIYIGILWRVYRHLCVSR